MELLDRRRLDGAAGRTGQLDGRELDRPAGWGKAFEGRELNRAAGWTKDSTKLLDWRELDRRERDSAAGRERAG
jgi:hypothetical protein